MASTILQIIQDVCGELGLTVPNTAAQSSDSQIQQLVRIANRVGRDLAKQHPWQALTTTQFTFTTTQGVGTYNLPADFQRISPQTEWDKTNHWPLLGPKTAAEWAFLQGGIIATGPRMRFRILRNQINLFPLPGGVYTLSFEYVSNAWVNSGGGTAQRFALDADTCIFDDDLMIAAIELRWLERKGLDSSAAADEYDRILSLAKSQDQDAPVLSISRRQSPLLISPANIPESNYGL